MALLSRKRIVLYGTAVAVALAIWQYKWRLASVALDLARPKHAVLSASAWWEKAAVPGQFDAAIAFLPDVEPAERGALLSRTGTLEPDARLAVVWHLTMAGSPEAFEQFEPALAATAPAKLPARFGELDAFGLCASREPVDETDRRAKRAAARLWLSMDGGAAAREFGGNAPCSAGGAVPTTASLRWLVCSAALEALPPACAPWLVTHLDDPAWPAEARAIAHTAAGLIGRAGLVELVRRLTASPDPQVRAWAALGLTAGAPNAADREFARAELERAAGGGSVAEPRLAAAVAARLGEAGSARSP